MLPSILTFTGRYFYFTEPDPGSVNIVDIATALSRICRFTGHTKQFYSVAQHSVYVSYLVEKEQAKQGLMHDAAEAYLGDVSSPLKQLLPDYKSIEHSVERCILSCFGLPFPLHPSIKKADLRMLVTEKRDLMPDPLPGAERGEWDWLKGVEPMAARIVPLPPDEAKALFLTRFIELTRGD